MASETDTNRENVVGDRYRRPQLATADLVGSRCPAHIGVLVCR